MLKTQSPQSLTLGDLVTQTVLPYLMTVGYSSVLMKTTISKAIVTPNRPMHATMVLNQNIPAVVEHKQSGLEPTFVRLVPNTLWRLTVREKGSNETGNSGYNVRRGEGEAPADSIDGEQDE